MVFPSITFLPLAVVPNPNGVNIPDVYNSDLYINLTLGENKNPEDLKRFFQENKNTANYLDFLKAKNNGENGKQKLDNFSNKDGYIIADYDMQNFVFYYFGINKDNSDIFNSSLDKNKYLDIFKSNLLKTSNLSNNIKNNNGAFSINTGKTIYNLISLYNEFNKDNVYIFPKNTFGSNGMLFIKKEGKLYAFKIEIKGNTIYIYPCSVKKEGRKFIFCSNHNNKNDEKRIGLKNIKIGNNKYIISPSESGNNIDDILDFTNKLREKYDNLKIIKFNDKPGANIPFFVYINSDGLPQYFMFVFGKDGDDNKIRKFLKDKGNSTKFQIID